MCNDFLIIMIGIQNYFLMISMTNLILWPANIYLFKINIETVQKGVKYVQSLNY